MADTDIKTVGREEVARLVSATITVLDKDKLKGYLDSVPDERLDDAKGFLYILVKGSRGKAGGLLSRDPVYAGLEYFAKPKDRVIDKDYISGLGLDEQVVAVATFLASRRTKEADAAIEEAEKRATQLGDYAEQANVRALGARAERASGVARIEALGKELETAYSDLGVARKEKEDAERAKEAADQLAAEASGRASGLETSLASVRGDYSGLEKRFDEATRDLGIARTTLQLRERVLDEATTKLAEAEKRVDGYKKFGDPSAIDARYKELELAKGDLIKKQEVVEAAQRQKDAAVARKADAEKEKLAAEAARTVAQSAQQAAEQERDAKEAEKLAAETERDHARSKLSRYPAEPDQVVLRSELDAKEAARKVLETRFTDIDSDKDPTYTTKVARDAVVAAKEAEKLAAEQAKSAAETERDHARSKLSRYPAEPDQVVLRSELDAKEAVSLKDILDDQDAEIEYEGVEELNQEALEGKSTGELAIMAAAYTEGVVSYRDAKNLKKEGLVSAVGMVLAFINGKVAAAGTEIVSIKKDEIRRIFEQGYRSEISEALDADREEGEGRSFDIGEGGRKLFDTDEDRVEALKAKAESGAPLAAYGTDEENVGVELANLGSETGIHDRTGIPTESGDPAIKSVDEDEPSPPTETMLVGTDKYFEGAFRSCLTKEERRSLRSEKEGVNDCVKGGKMLREYVERRKKEDSAYVLRESDAREMSLGYLVDKKLVKLKEAPNPPARDESEDVPIAGTLVEAANAEGIARERQSIAKREKTQKASPEKKGFFGRLFGSSVPPTIESGDEQVDE